jgi:large subunit ribosomal protein L22
MPVTHTNERPGTRAVLRHYHMSASKARLVLNLVRGCDVIRAQEILASTPREAASVVSKVLASAVANAVNNDSQDADELFVTSAFADEGTTMKRFRPRARGRAGRIRKRSCHITIIVARMDDAQLQKSLASRSSDGTARARRVAGSRRRADQQSHAHRREVAREEAAEAEAESEVAAAEAAAAEAVAGEQEHDADAVDADGEATTDETSEDETSENETSEDGEGADPVDAQDAATGAAAAETGADAGDAGTASKEHTD